MCIEAVEIWLSRLSEDLYHTLPRGIAFRSRCTIDHLAILIQAFLFLHHTQAEKTFVTIFVKGDGKPPRPTFHSAQSTLKSRRTTPDLPKLDFRSYKVYKSETFC